MELAVNQAGLEVDHFVAGDHALLRLGADGVLHGGNELTRDTAAGDFIGPFNTRTSRQGLEDHLHFSELARTA